MNALVVVGIAAASAVAGVAAGYGFRGYTAREGKKLLSEATKELVAVREEFGKALSGAEAELRGVSTKVYALLHRF